MLNLDQKGIENFYGINWYKCHSIKLSLLFSFTAYVQVFFSAYFGLLDQIILEMHMKLENHDGQWKKDDSNNKWTNFQYAFKLIEVCGKWNPSMLCVETRDMDHNK